MHKIQWKHKKKEMQMEGKYFSKKNGCSSGKGESELTSILTQNKIELSKHFLLTVLAKAKRTPSSPPSVRTGKNQIKPNNSDKEIENVEVTKWEIVRSMTNTKKVKQTNKNDQELKMYVPRAAKPRGRMVMLCRRKVAGCFQSIMLRGFAPKH